MFKSFNLPLTIFNFRGNTYVKQEIYCTIVNGYEFQTMKVFGENVV